MKPLLFLTTKSLFNGIKRGLTSPKRLITTIILIAYYLWLFVLRPMATMGSSGRRASLMKPSGNIPHFDFPPLPTLDALLFAGFALLSLFMALSLFSYRASFKPADVDVLFPTPVNPKAVLGFRMLRDYLATLLVPLIFILMTWRSAAPSIGFLFRNVPNPQTLGYALRALSLAFVLMTLTWVTIGYAISMYVNRNDRSSDRRKKLIAIGIGAAHFAVIGYIVYAAQSFHKFADFVIVMQQGALRVFFFPATFASKIVMGPLDGNLSESLIGGGTLLAIAAVCIWLTLRQAEWMYDQSAVRGFGSENLRQMQRRGDLIGAVAVAAAKSGKPRRKRWGWFQRLNLSGGVAIIWKDILIQWRSTKSMVFVFLALGLMMSVVPLFASKGGRVEGYTVLAGSGLGTFMIANMLAQFGFAELLKRGDLLKPLPFSSFTITASETLAKAVPSIAIPVLISLVSLVLSPQAWPFSLASIAFFPSVGILICAANCCLILIFPDLDDVAQRGFRGLMSILAIALAVAPGALLFFAIAALLKMLVVGAIVGAIVNLGASILIMLACGGLYASFNPSE